MSIFVNKDTRILVQGITGREGQFHTKQCIAYGSNVVAVLLQQMQLWRLQMLE